MNSGWYPGRLWREITQCAHTIRHTNEQQTAGTPIPTPPPTPNTCTHPINVHAVEGGFVKPIEQRVDASIKKHGRQVGLDDEGAGGCVVKHLFAH